MLGLCYVSSGGGSGKLVDVRARVHSRRHVDCTIHHQPTSSQCRVPAWRKMAPRRTTTPRHVTRPTNRRRAAAWRHSRSRSWFVESLSCCAQRPLPNWQRASRRHTGWPKISGQCVDQARKVHKTTTLLLITLPYIHPFQKFAHSANNLSQFAY